MRTYVLVVASAGGCWLAGCSRPAPEHRRDPVAQATTTRDLQLIEAPASLTPTVSDLEAGRTQIRSGIPTAEQHHPRHAPPLPLPDAKRATATGALAAMALDRAPTLSTTAASAPEVSQVLVQAPVAAEMYSTGGLRPAPVDEVVDRGVTFAGRDRGTTFAGRDPVIIIRGGRGGRDDDCDLDRPGGGAHHHGVAINRVAPSFTGGVTVSGRTPRLISRSGGGFSPRGIR